MSHPADAPLLVLLNFLFVYFMIMSIHFVLDLVTSGNFTLRRQEAYRLLGDVSELFIIACWAAVRATQLTG